MKKALVIYGHPVKDTYSESLLNNYLQGLERSGSEVQVLQLRDMQFKLNLEGGYRIEQTLEPDLLRAQDLITWSEHITFIFPNWWTTFPALLKGFIDRTFLPGFAFSYASGIRKSIKLLKNRSARIIITMDNSPLKYRFYYCSPAINALKKGTLEFCGIAPVKSTLIGPIKNSSAHKKERWRKKVLDLGRSDGKQF